MLPITVEDMKQAVYIYRPDMATLQGKMTRRVPNAISNSVPIKLPAELLKPLMDIDLTTDIFMYREGHTNIQ